MNRVIIPATLASIILIAAVFAFIPVDNANTVHDTLATQPVTVTKSDANNDFDQGETLVLTCDDDTVIDSIVMDVGGNNYQAGDEIAIIVDVDGGGSKGAVTVDSDYEGTPADSMVTATTGAIGLEADGTVTFSFTTENDDVGDEDMDIHFTFRSTGTCS